MEWDFKTQSHTHTCTSELLISLKVISTLGTHTNLVEYGEIEKIQEKSRKVKKIQENLRKFKKSQEKF